MVSAQGAVRDLRALGGSFPLRAMYEVSKRSGFHSVLFRSRAEVATPRSHPLSLGSHLPASETARQRCLHDAEQILEGGTRVFGLGYVPTGFHAPWNTDPLTGKSWPQLDKWWDIDIRSDDRLSDVKYVWEAARHRDLVVLARAAAIEPDGPWMPRLTSMLQAWVMQCPPERGVNWYSSLELALRAIAWSQVLRLAGEGLSDGVRTAMDAQLVASARHITLELPYTVSSMKNNHLLGDGLGLVVLGRMFPDHKASERWQRLGDRIFLKQLARHMRPDGSMIEDSLSYHRFVLEMLIVRVLVGGAHADVVKAMAEASSHLRTLGVFDGEVPQFGDWDEGRVLADSAPAGSVAGSAWLGLALGGEKPPTAMWGQHDELAWYAAQVAGGGEPLPTAGQVAQGGGFTRVRQGPWSVWFKTGSGSSHQHADVSAIYVRNEDSWVICDPGTGTYNGPLRVRNGFRTSSAHPVWHPVGVDQMDPHRAFRWLRSVRGYAALPLITPGRVLLFGWHDAFEATTDSGRVARAVVVTDDGILIKDFIEHQLSGNPWQLTVPLPPGGTPDQLFGLDPAVMVEGREEPFAGWHSATYGVWRPAKWLMRESLASDLPEWGAGSRPEGLDLTVAWDQDAVTLRVSGAQGTDHLRALRGKAT